MNKSQTQRDIINDQAISVMRYLSVVFIPEILLRSVQQKDKAKQLFVAFLSRIGSLCGKLARGNKNRSLIYINKQIIIYWSF